MRGIRTFCHDASEGPFQVHVASHPAELEIRATASYGMAGARLVSGA